MYMNKMFLAIFASILIFSFIVNVYAQPDHKVDKDSNYYKNCIKIKNKLQGQIECPDVFGSTSFVPGG